jgi:hypothetical protein
MISELYYIDKLSASGGHISCVVHSVFQQLYPYYKGDDG